MLSREGLNPFENAVDITDPSHLSFDSENEISGEILNEACKIQASKDLPRERLPFTIPGAFEWVHEEAYLLSREGLNPFENAVDITDPSHLSFDSENERSGEILNEACKIQASKDLPRERLPFDIQEDLKSLLEKEQHKFKEAAAKGSVSTLWQQLQHYRKIKIAEETESINKDLNFKLKHIQEQARKTEAIYREAYEEARQSMIRANFDAGRQFVFGATEKVHEAAVVQGVSDERVVDLRSGMCKKILLRDPAGELQSVYVVAAQEIDQQQIITADDIGNHFEYVMVDNSTSKTTSPKSAPQ